MLGDVEREHLFLLGLGRPPEPRYQPAAPLSPRIQRVLDAFPASPAFVKTLSWDLVAWNRAAAAIFGYDAASPDRRNILRRIFLDPDHRARQPNWDAVARFVVSVFRADAARAHAGAGPSPYVDALVRELRHRSLEFDAFWQADQDVRSHGEGSKVLVHPAAGPLSMEYSSFTVDGRPELSMVIYNPATQADADKVLGLVAALPSTGD